MAMKEIDFSGKTALITGGGAGIGRAIAELFADRGANIVVAETHEKRCKDLEKSLIHKNSSYLVSRTDVRDAKQVKSLMGEIENKFASLDIVVNNVGDFLELIKPFEDLTDDEIDDLYAINLKSMFLVTRSAIPLIRKNKNQGSSIINLSSIEAFRGIPLAAVYSSFKHAITGFTRSLAVELAPKGIRVNAIAPETTETIQVQPSKTIPEKYQEHIKRWNPLGRFGQPSDAAGCALFLASDLSAWVTGATINLDGGALAAAGWYRDPNNSWTIAPVILEDGFDY